MELRDVSCSNEDSGECGGASRLTRPQSASVLFSIEEWGRVFNRHWKELDLAVAFVIPF